VDETKAYLGLDKPIHAQFLSWLRRAATFDFGNSYKDGRPVLDKIGEALPITLLLNIVSMFLIYLIAIPIGASCAMRPSGFLDRISSVVMIALYSLPNFWLALMLMVWLGSPAYLNWFPIAGIISDSAAGLPWYGTASNVLWHMALPVACLVLTGLAFMSRLTRASMIGVMREDFIRTARAKGLPEWKVVMKHGMKNAMIPFVALLGSLFPQLIAGSVIIEEMFSIPGMGRLGFESVLTRDYPVVMAIAVISALLTLASTLLSDIVHAALDRRVSFEGI
jgi:peptide/nickel transport system permease protein